MQTIHDAIDEYRSNNGLDPYYRKDPARGGETTKVSINNKFLKGARVALRKDLKTCKESAEMELEVWKVFMGRDTVLSRPDVARMLQMLDDKVSFTCCS